MMFKGKIKHIYGLTLYDSESTKPLPEQMLIYHQKSHQEHMDGLVQDCSNSIAATLELLQSCN